MEKQEKKKVKTKVFFSSFSFREPRTELCCYIRFDDFNAPFPSRFLYTHVIYISHCCLGGSYKELPRSYWQPLGLYTFQLLSLDCRRVFLCFCNNYRCASFIVPKIKERKKKRRLSCNAQRTVRTTHYRHPSAKWTVKRLPLHI